MVTMNVADFAGTSTAVEKPLAPGRAAAASSRPVALSTEDAAFLDGIETALAALGTQTTLAAINTILGAAADAASPTTTIKAALRQIAATGIPITSGTVTANAGTGTFNTELGQLFGIAPTGSHKAPSLVVRSDTPSVPHGNGTYTYLQVDGSGKQWVNTGVQLGGQGANSATTQRIAIVDEQLGTLILGSVPVISGANLVKFIPANTTSAALETGSGTGAVGDLFESIIVVVSNATAAQVLIGDGGTPGIEIFPANPASGINSYQYTFAMRSVAGSWRIKTGTGCSAIVTGRWT